MSCAYTNPSREPQAVVGITGANGRIYIYIVERANGKYLLCVVCDKIVLLLLLLFVYLLYCLLRGEGVRYVICIIYTIFFLSNIVGILRHWCN